MSSEAFLLIREAADGMTSIELADALRCSRRTAVHHLVTLKLAAEIESAGVCRDGAAVFRVRAGPVQMRLAIAPTPPLIPRRVRRLFPAIAHRKRQLAADRQP